MKNKKNNKGFSLVELIVVVAIMAVLVGVLAPAYLKYVENSRINKDKTNAEEFIKAAEVAFTDEAIYNTVKFNTGADITITISDATAITVAADGSVGGGAVVAGGTCGDLVKEMTAAVSDTLDLTSKKLNGGTLVITFKGTTLKVSGELKDSAGNVVQ